MFFSGGEPINARRFYFLREAEGEEEEEEDDDDDDGVEEEKDQMSLDSSIVGAPTMTPLSIITRNRNTVHS